MLLQEISNKILTIGCEYHRPKGGVAQVIKNYSLYVFPTFKCITNSGGKQKIRKLQKAIGGLLFMAWRLLTDREIRIVHIHTASYNSFKRSAWYVKVAKCMGKRVLLHIHGGGFKEYYATDSRRVASVLNSCDAIITLSESWQRFFKGITTCSNISVLENIVPYPKACQRTDKSGTVHFLFLGLIDEAKGIFDLITALSHNKQRLQGKFLLHIGGIGKVRELQKLITDSAVADIVKYEGWVSGDRKIELLQNAGVFILPSYTEGLPVSILEAISYKMPVLSTPVGGIPEVVKNNVNGILFPPGDEDAIMRAVVRMLENGDERQKMGEESFIAAESYFPECISRKLEKIYAALL